MPGVEFTKWERLASAGFHKPILACLTLAVLYRRGLGGSTHSSTVGLEAVVKPALLGGEVEVEVSDPEGGRPPLALQDTRDVARRRLQQFWGECFNDTFNFLGNSLPI